MAAARKGVEDDRDSRIDVGDALSVSWKSRCGR